MSKTYLKKFYSLKIQNNHKIFRKVYLAHWSNVIQLGIKNAELLYSFLSKSIYEISFLYMSNLILLELENDSIDDKYFWSFWCSQTLSTPHPT